MGYGAAASKGIKGVTTALKRAPKCPAGGYCFVAGTPIATAAGTTPIEAIRVGERVQTPDGGASTEVDPATWRKVTLKVRSEAQGETLSVEALRPEWWLLGTGCEAGAKLWFELPEIEVRGWAEVEKVEQCPALATGQGRVVLTTMTRPNIPVVEVKLSGQPSLKLTAGHRLFSQTRNQWTVATSLQNGELLTTSSGTAKVESVAPLPDAQRVFNMEVESAHCYFAGDAGVLAHNACGSSLYNDVTTTGSRYANRATDATRSAFEKQLTDTGWLRSASKDGKVVILEKNGSKYVLRDGAKSTGGPTADFYKAGSQGIDVKIRLK